MKLKEGVRLIGLHNQMVVAMLVCSSVFGKLGQELVITSVVEGKHKDGSLHYSGQAFDLRTRNMSRYRARLITAELKHRLPTDFDIILESNHIHIEYQPKKQY